MLERLRARMIRWFEDPGKRDMLRRADFNEALCRRADAIGEIQADREFPREVSGVDMVPPEVRAESRKREWEEQLEIGRQTFARMQARERRAHEVLMARWRWWPW